MQQGRVLLDADWNEQSAILLHYLQTLATDLIGPHGGPGDGFKIEFGTNGDNQPDLIIKQGHYYVDGILCENDKDVSYFNQPNYQADGGKLPQDIPYLVYLDVWERHVTCFEDESLCEVALGGIDTTTRTKTVWQVKLRPLDKGDKDNKCDKMKFPDPSNARLIADVPSSDVSDDPCNIEPDALYRGAENQLYRVEIHTGNVNELGEIGKSITPTFKWSRENGTVVFPVISITTSDDKTKVTLASLGRDDKFTLNEGDWVELVDDAYTLHNRATKLLKVSIIDRDEMIVTLDGTSTISADRNSGNHSLLRRWDQKAGNAQEGGLTLLAGDNAAEIIEGSGNINWLKLEDGIKIQFQETIVRPKHARNMAAYHTGDYWLIPARTATGDIEWEKDGDGNPLPQPPHGIEHHYAPLVIASIDGTLKPCRCTFTSISK